MEFNRKMSYSKKVMISLIALLIIPAVLGAAPRAYWNYNGTVTDGNNFTDWSGNGFDLVRSEGTQLTSGCPLDNCFTTDDGTIESSDDAEYADSPRIINESTGTYTYAFWIKIGAGGCPGAYRSVLGQTNAFWVQCDAENDGLQATVRTGSYYNEPIVGAYVIDQWYFVVMSVNTTDVCVSLDNASFSCTSYSGSFNSVNTGFDAPGAGGSAPPNVTIDEFTVYDYAFTQQNVTDYYCASNSSTPCSGGAPPAAGNNLVLNVTFDDDTQCGYDYSTVHTELVKQGSADCIDDRNICKWYGCVNLTDTSGDYLNDTMLFDMNDKFSVLFWIYPTVSPPTTTQAYFIIEGADVAHTVSSEEGDYGFNSRWMAATGEVGGNPGSSKSTSANTWTHYAATYNGTHYKSYKNGVLIDNDNDAFGNLNVSSGDEIQLGRGLYGTDLIGYMDEVLMYNTTLNITTINEIYDTQKEGTPPEVDLIVSNHTITDAMNSLYNFSQENNTLNMTGVFNLEYTIRNLGNTSVGSFNTTVIINGSEICKNLTSLNAFESKTFECNIAKNVGFLIGNINVDSDNDINEESYEGGNDTNNQQRVYIDFRVHPRLLPPLDLAYLAAPGDDPAKDAYTAIVSFVSEDFNPSWTADNSDPRGKKGYENAMSCYLSGYDVADSACTRARNHLDGWLHTVDDWADGSVQAIHALEWIAKTYDVMFNNLTQTEATNYAINMSNVCLEVYGKENVRPHTDDITVSAGNGKGFGLGMAYPCIVTLGETTNNPSNIYQPGDDVYSYSTPYEWYARANRHIKGSLNGTGAAEGIVYWNYASYHLAGMLWFDSQTDIANVSATSQGDLCGKGKVALYYYLDNTYDGNTLRGDDSNNARWASFGDSHAYDTIGEMEVTGASMVTTLALVCDDTDVQDGLFTIRNIMYDRGGSNAYERPMESMFYYKTLADIATNLTEPQMSALFYYEVENAWDKYILRNGYSFVNDTVIYIDGADKPGFGHPNAEFDLTVYALGEPFLEQPQVSFADDVRTERWHNTLSLSNSTATGYTTDPYNPPLHQPYGGATNPPLSGYPSGDYMPDGRRGWLIDYFGLPTFVGGVRMYQPYNDTSSDPQRRIIIYDDVILDYYIVHRTSSGHVQFNWLNIFEEFTPTISGTDLSFNRAGTNKYYNISVLYTDNALTLEGGNSTVRASKQKTGSANLDVFYGSYRHYNTAVEDTNSIFLHHWYEGTDTKTITPITDGNDRGIKINSAVDLLLDTGNDGTTFGDYLTDGWGLIINSTHIGSFNATYIGNSTNNFSLPYTPYSGMVNFTAAAPPAPDTDAPIITNLLTTDVLTTQQRITFNTDEEQGANRTINYGNTTALGTISEYSSYTNNHNQLLTLLMPNTTYYFNITVCDGEANCAVNGTFNFTTAAPGSGTPITPNLIPGLIGFMIIIIAVSLMSLIYQSVEGEGWKTAGGAVMIIMVVVTVLIGIVVIAALL